MSRIKSQLSEIKGRIDSACRVSGREPGTVSLVAVSKTFPADDIREAVSGGQRIFGESRLQEAEPKIDELPRDLEWHFIGRIQRNKVRKILPLFPFIHAVDSLKLAEYMDGVALELGLRPRVFLQVNQAGEESKGGMGTAELQKGFPEFLGLKNLDIVGFMTIPPPAEADQSRRWFRELREFRDRLEGEFSTHLPFLSMGMSGDFEVAIQEGATHVRVGSAIFGKRDYKVEGELG